MDSDRTSYVFQIDALSPETLPMERLAAYMADLAKFVGHTDQVHFVSISEGSAKLGYFVDPGVAVDANSRVQTAQAGAGPKDALQAYHALNRKLEQDNSTGSLVQIGGAEILHFPGAQASPEHELRGFGGHGSLDGTIQRVGKLGNEASVLLQTRDMQISAAKVSKEIARRLALHIFGPEVRLIGYGTWKRTRDGLWVIHDFRVQSFVVLSATPLTDVVAELHKIEGAEWAASTDPWGDLDRLRHGEPDIAQ